MVVSHPADIRERDGDFEVVVTFEADYRGTCALNNTHPVRKGTRVGRIREIANPLISIPGVACEACTKSLPRAVR